MMRLSIRWRLSLWYAAALAVVLTVFCLVLLVVTRQQQLARTDVGLREELQELALEAELARNQDEFLDRVHQRFYQHEIYDFIITDHQGQILFASAGLTPAQVRALAPEDSDGDFRFTNRDLGGNHAYRQGRVRAASPLGELSLLALTSLTPLDADLRTLQLVTAVLLPLGVVLALAGGYFLASRALAPVEQIAKTAETISISNLHQRIEIGHQEDELGRLAATLNSLIARLERAVAEIQRFTADASHELRTPLAVLRSEAELSLRRLRTPDEYQQTLKNVVEEATRLGRLADQLLNLSRHDAGIVECRRELVRLDALLADVAEQLQPLADDRGLSLHVAERTPCEILGDDLQLRQALFNVLENALKYTPSGGSITLRSEIRGSEAVLEVRDTGLGIPSEHLPRVFDRFYRVDPSRQSTTGGAGLGLAITLATIRQHGGDISIQSEERGGTTVTMRLPGAVAVSESSPLRVNNLSTMKQPSVVSASS